MSFFSLVLLAVGLSMDAFAVSVASGIRMKHARINDALIIALFFGGFQGLMPTLGYLASYSFYGYICNVDHWIAFLLLAFIGGKMVIEAVKEDDSHKGLKKIKFKRLTVLAVATSIDAFAAGITISMTCSSIVGPAFTIALITFGFSLFGVVFGKKLGKSFGKKTEIFGGLVLIFLGVKIVAEHLFFS